jgi:hypothetical protein
MRVHFASDVGFNKTYSFTVSSAMGNTLNFVSIGFEFNMTAAPILTQDAREANVTFVAPSGSNFRGTANSSYTEGTVAGFPSLTRVYKPWKAYSTDFFYAGYGAVNQYMLNLDSFQREIVVGNDGTLSVSERFHIHNPAVIISSLTLTLEDGAYNVMAYDEVGALWFSAQNPAAPYQVTVQPRGSASIKSGENFTFTLTYNLPQSKYLKQLKWWGSYNLSFVLLENKDDFLYQNATVRIVAPAGTSITDLNIEPQSPVSDPIQISPDDRTFQLQEVTNQANLSSGATLGYVPFWSAFSVLPWITGVEALIVAFALVLRLRKPPEAAVPVPVENLREFVGLYDERLALTREIVLMEEEVSRGGLVKHEFRRRRKVMDQRLDELNRSLMTVKSELRTTSPHHEELIRRIDRAEAEIEASRASMNQVKGQYRSGKVTRETYDHLTNEISKRIDRAEETLETTLITLREEAR